MRWTREVMCVGPLGRTVNIFSAVLMAEFRYFVRAPHTPPHGKARLARNQRLLTGKLFNPERIRNAPSHSNYHAIPSLRWCRYRRQRGSYAGRHLECAVSNLCLSEVLGRFEQFTSGERDGPEMHPWAERFVMGFPLPAWQRPLIWTPDQKVRFILSIWSGVDIGSYREKHTRPAILSLLLGVIPPGYINTNSRLGIMLAVWMVAGVMAGKTSREQIKGADSE